MSLALTTRVPWERAPEHCHHEQKAALMEQDMRFLHAFLICLAECLRVCMVWWFSCPPKLTTRHMRQPPSVRIEGSQSPQPSNIHDEVFQVQPNQPTPPKPASARVLGAKGACVPRCQTARLPREAYRVSGKRSGNSES